MSSRRRGRRAAERRIEKMSRRTPITIWAIIVIALVVLAVGIARSLS